ncbi:type II toxin-antitoxin system RelE/ParE family toxin [Phormidesmis priestleyi]
MSQQYKLTAPASRDIEDILDFIAGNRSDTAADQFLRKLNQKLGNLTRFPEIGRKRDDLASGLRSVSLDRYLIFYRLIDSGIEILRVVSGYQDLEALFSSLDDV